MLAVISGLAFGATTASAKEVVDYFGNTPTFPAPVVAPPGSLGGEFNVPTGVAVNQSGAGPADQGDIYVVDAFNDRIQRFGRNDNGTPANGDDDSYFFISAWGADVDATPSSGTDYEICTVAAECKAAVASGGNGSLAGNGALADPAKVAVDQDTGSVYVSESDNRRISVYAGDGTFLRAFGFDVVAAGPGNVGTGYEVCVAAAGDVCKAGVAGAGVGQVGPSSEGSTQTLGIAVSQPDNDADSGTVFLADTGNRRVGVYGLDGSSPSSFGSAAIFGDSVGAANDQRPSVIAVDSRGIVYASTNKNHNEIARYDTENANGAGVGFLAPIAAPPLTPTDNNSAGAEALAVDPDSDDGGPDTDVLYVMRGIADAVQQFGPLNSPGLTAPPAALDAEHGTLSNLTYNTWGLGLDEATGRLFVSASKGGDQVSQGVYVLGNLGPPPTVTLDSLSDVTSNSVTAHATINPNGQPALSYYLEYSTDGSNWTPGSSVTLGAQTTPQSVSTVLEPPPLGLEPSTFYHVRLVAKRLLYPGLTTPELTFTTAAEKPSVETTGAPVRGATNAQLNGRVDPRGLATTYHFEYGSEGPCDTNSCQATPNRSAGSSSEIRFVTEAIGGLAPNTTYHYRLVADNGGSDSPVFAGDRTLRTTPSDSPLSHGHFPGPPGSDRAYEQVSLPDSGGNPVGEAWAFSTEGDSAGNRAIYSVNGGTPIGESGTSFGGSLIFAERTLSGWQSRLFTPVRPELLPSPIWGIRANDDLSQVFGVNAEASGENIVAWGLPTAGGQPSRLFKSVPPQHRVGTFQPEASTDGSRVLVHLGGGIIDPAYPTAGASGNFYDVSTGEPHLATVLPSGQPACLASPKIPPSATGWVSDDGSSIVFPSQDGVGSCDGAILLYIRDLGLGLSKLISASPASGPTCSAYLLRATDDSVFFWTQSRLSAVDTSIQCSSSGSNPMDGDVYRYDIGDGSRECVTCAASVDADVDMNLSSNSPGSTAVTEVAIAPDGSRVYFKTHRRLLKGAPSSGWGMYRVDVLTGDLAYVAPVGDGDNIGQAGAGGSAISSDGSVLIFRSANLGLNPVGGSDNGGSAQYYRYDDSDRSLVCVSCPADGSPSLGSVPRQLPGDDHGRSPLTEDGSTFAFAAPTPLVGADQNTPQGSTDLQAGTDIYEWRDGRVLLVTDGLTSWPALPSVVETPEVSGIGPTGRDLYFTAPIQYTPDALDGYRRLYDARIGGGIEFSPPAPPCPLEVCQGIPKGAPEEAAPGTGAFSGPGNRTLPVKRCSKGKVRRRGRCVTKHSKAKRHTKAKRHSKRKHRANHDRRVAR